MKTILKFLLVFTCISAIKVTGQGIIIDHTCTNLDAIPLSIIDQVKSQVKYHYSHSSYGRAIRCGLAAIEVTNPDYDIAVSTIDPCTDVSCLLPTTPGALCILDGQFANGCTCYITPYGYWLGAGGVNWTIETLNENPALNVSHFTWCAEPEGYTVAQINDYLSKMEWLESQKPNVTFVYSTCTSQQNGDLGYNRYLRNKQIRDYCIANNKVLFDVEDIQAWYDGVQNYYVYNAQNIPLQHSAYNGSGCNAHMNDLCSLQHGKATWWMMARIRGWQNLPMSQSLSTKANLQGNYSPSGMNTLLNSHGLLPLNQPFNIPPLYYNGNESVQVIPNTSIVEWVLIELRDAATAQTANSNTMILQKAAFILSNGQIVDLDGSSNIQFNQTIYQQLFIVIRHRNHLGIMSSFPLSLNSNIYQYDFTTGSEQSYGGSNSQIQLSPGVWGMIGGDGNLDGVIDNVDKTFTWTNNSGEEGYYSGDFNLNGNVNNQDKNLIWVINFGKTSYIP